MKRSKIAKVALFFCVIAIALFVPYFVTAAPTPTPGTCTLTLKISSLSGYASLEVSPPGETFSGKASKTYTYPIGTVVTIKPINYNSSDGSWVEAFQLWQGDLTGTKNPATIVMDGNKSVTAVFVHGDRFITPTPTPRRITTVTPTPTPIANGSMAISYVIQSDWGNGATVSVTIVNNTSTPVNGWTLAWTFSGNQTITNLWNGTYTQSGAAVSVKDAGFNATIPANGGSVNFGFNLNYSGTNAKPIIFTLNGVACQIQ